MSGKAGGKEQQVRILCFGDSLTDGYSRMGAESYPYATTMLAKLEADKKEHYPNCKLSVRASGVPGERLMDMGPRFRTLLSGAERKTEAYSFVIVLAGTNDICQTATEVDRLMKVTSHIHQSCKSHGARLLLATVPSFAYCTVDSVYEKRRTDLNTALKDFASQNSPCTLLVDLERLSWTSMSKADRQRYFDRDALHYTEDGYALMGTVFYEAVAPLIRANSGFSAVNPSTSSSCSSTSAKSYI